jgi:hypothetical protein
MNYAIETLDIEIGKQKDLLRIINRNSHKMMSNMPGEESEKRKLKELEEARGILAKYQEDE